MTPLLMPSRVKMIQNDVVVVRLSFIAFPAVREEPRISIYFRGSMPPDPLKSSCLRNLHGLSFQHYLVLVLKVCTLSHTGNPGYGHVVRLQKSRTFTKCEVT